MHRKILTIIIQLSVIQLFAQNSPNFHPPLKIPMFLSGNFGEIRTDHFHSGIDIKTQGTIGHHVFAIEEGYVSRIKVQANGYGKSIYLAHPNGYTSVFGHLDQYREDIAEYVKEIQYQRRSHQVDIYLDPGQFKLQKGDFIAYSGNSGGSYGPHLHFEVRNSANQHPTNVLKYGFDIKDHIAPRFVSLFLYPVGETGHVNGSGERQSFDLLLDNGSYTVPWGTRLEAGGEIGISVEVYDYLDGVSNQCGVFTLEVYAADRLTYSHVMEEFSFSETRYINAHINYEERISTGKKAHRLHRLPNDKLRIYGYLANDGILAVHETRSYPIRIVATDVAGNRSECNFTITGFPVAKAPTRRSGDDMVRIMKYDESSVFEYGDVKVEIPANALYEDLEFRYSVTGKTEGVLSGHHQIHHPGTPIHLPFKLSIIAPEVHPEHRDNLVLVTYDHEEEKIVSAGGTYVNGAVMAEPRSFGSYAVSLDTIAPEITPQNGSASGDLTGRKSLKFTILDDLSGIEKYEGYIDNRWALFEFDPKNELLTYSFDEERLSRNQIHELELYVSDSQGNVNLYHTTFTW